MSDPLNRWNNMGTSALKYLTATVLLCGACVASYLCGYYNNDTKNYEAACLEADFIHCLMDYEPDSSINGSEVEELFYEWFQDLDIGIYNTKRLKDVKELEQYHWCY